MGGSRKWPRAVKWGLLIIQVTHVVLPFEQAAIVSSVALQEQPRVLLTVHERKLIMGNIPEPKTFTYSFVDDLEIKLDLYVPPDAQGALPAIVYFHGGALTVGNREITDTHPTLIRGQSVIPYFTKTALTIFL